jgi:hypothetical protein
MKPHWVNICEREPEPNKEVQVLLISMGTNVEYARATPTNHGWDFTAEPASGQIVAWLESERFLNENELGEVPKDAIRAA